MRKTTKRHRRTEHLAHHHGACCEHTFCGLQHWYKAMFEKLGWMILAKKNGQSDKVNAYINSVHRLKNGIEHYWKHHAKDHDHKEDLMIMCDNVAILSEHVKQDFA